MSWSERKVLVTGAGGFIGSHLCEALAARGANVTALIRYSSRSDSGNLDFLSATHRNAIDVVAGNVEDAHFVSSLVRGQEVVFHLAALIAIPYSYVAPASYVRTNVEGTLNVLEAARRWKIPRLVHTSTSEAYGTARYTPIDEEHPLQGQSPYSASKIAADKLVESFSLSFGLPVVTLRPFNTYGPRQSARAVIPTIVSQALAADSVRLGSLDPVRDLTYVSDTVAGFLAAAERDEAIGQVINLGTGTAVTVGELAQRILQLLEKSIPIVTDPERVRPLKSEVLCLLSDNGKAKRLLGWKPAVALDQGLQDVIAFVRTHAQLFRPGRYTL